MEPVQQSVPQYPPPQPVRVPQASPVRASSGPIIFPGNVAYACVRYQQGL